MRNRYFKFVVIWHILMTIFIIGVCTTFGILVLVNKDASEHYIGYIFLVVAFIVLVAFYPILDFIKKVN
ncbi:hypothetical protein [Acholeplasma hippikon]|nr:hypothetical protein [Acholeplasma hippikon]